MKIAGFVAIVCAVASVALAVPRARGDALPTPAEQIREISRRWQGEFDNHQQVRTNLDRPGAQGPELTRERRQMTVVRLDAPQLGDEVLFFEEFRGDQRATAHRQRVVALSYDARRAQIRARQLFFPGSRYDRPRIAPDRVARMKPADFNLARPYCDLWFTYERELQRYRGAMQRGACVSESGPDGIVHAEFEMLLYENELWYRDRSIRLEANSIRGEIDGFSWLLFTRKTLPAIAKQQGVWRGTFRRYDPEGRLTQEFPTEITMRIVPSDGRLLYHQTNRYLPKGEPEEITESFGEVRDGRIYFGNARLDAWKMTVPGDSTGRSAVILMEYDDGSGLYVHQIVSVSDDGQRRSRATQYLKDGRIVRRTLIDEEKLTDDWRAFDASIGRAASTGRAPAAAENTR